MNRPRKPKTEDFSKGWNAVAEQFMAGRSHDIGVDIVIRWGMSFGPGREVLDVGCGFGGYYMQGVLELGINLHGIDAFRQLLDEYQRQFPSVRVQRSSPVF